MHYYAEDISNRLFIAFWIAVLSIALWFGIKSLLEWPLISTFAIFSGIWAILELFVWKMVPNSLYPNLNGEYDGVIKFDQDSKRKEVQINISIKQSFSRIIITGKTNSSESNSHIAALLKAEPDMYVLTYGYKATFSESTKLRAIKNGDPDNAIQDHLGYGQINFKKNNTSEGNGIYFTSPSHGVSGTMIITKKRQK